MYNSYANGMWWYAKNGFYRAAVLHGRFSHKLIPRSNPQPLHTPTVHFEHKDICFSRKSAKHLEFHASCKVCRFRSTENALFSIPKEHGKATHFELIYIENRAASQNSIDSAAMPEVTLCNAGA